MDYYNKQIGTIETTTKPNHTAHIVEELIRLRKEHNMSQQDIADMTGMKRPNIARIESCKYTPTVDVLVRYAKCFDKKIEISLK